MKRFAMALTLACALLGSRAVLKADDDDHRERVRERVYQDRVAHDEHRWDDREDRAWRHYLEQNHKQYREFDKMRERDQRQYWQWRHNNPDWDRH